MRVAATGIIVRRRSMGRSLAFADIKIIKIISVDNNCDDFDDYNNDGMKQNGREHLDDDDGPKSSLNENCDRILHVKFRRASPFWDESKDGNNTFPTKASSLPYGAQVRLELREREREHDKGVTSTFVAYSDVNADSASAGNKSNRDSDNDETATTTTNQNNHNTKKNKVSLFSLDLEVCCWEILEHPSDIATTKAAAKTRNNDRAVDFDDIGNEYQASSNKNDHNDGISCTEYLRARGEMFLSVNQHPQQEQSIAKIEKKRSNNNHQAKRTIAATTTTTTEDQSSSIQQFFCECCSNNNNDYNSNCHGDKRAKTLRAKIFASWLIETFGIYTLKKKKNSESSPVQSTPTPSITESTLFNKDISRVVVGDHLGSTSGSDSDSSTVLDIAGGKGQLSVELSILAQIPCTVIDPLIRGKRRGSNRALPKKELKRMNKVDGPHPCYIAKCFRGDDYHCLQPKQRHNYDLDHDIHNERVGDNEDDDDHHHGGNHDDMLLLVQRATCLVGLHPDECTEDILDVALRLHKPVAIVPCCVFPTLFPTRRLLRRCPAGDGDDDVGKPVRTYDEFLQYLLEKDDRLQKATLPFEGKNQVIYLKV